MSTGTAGDDRGRGTRRVHKDILRNGDVLSAAVLAALGVYIFMEARNWPYYSEDGPGPAFFPVWYGVAMVVLSLALIAITIAKKPKAEEPDWQGVRRALITWAAFAVCSALMGWLGFMVSFAILTFFMITFVFGQPPVKAGIVAVAAAAGFYLVFPFALSVPLPTGVFGF
jgi:putative tricarboxylic transport membrane protein